MSTYPPCPQCSSAFTYHDSIQYVCPDCTYEWSDEQSQDENQQLVVKDSNGNVLQDGDSVILIKDLKVKGSSVTLKKGTKIKNIRLTDADHNVDCKVEGMSIGLKSEFMKKA